MKHSVLRVAGLALAVSIGASAPALADRPLASGELRQKVVGKIVYLRVFGTELPIAYRPNGTMVGEAHGFVGAAVAGSGPHRDTGRWWIEDGQLCQRWRQWMNGRAYCYRLSLSGDYVTWHRDDGRSGTARIGG